MDKVQKIIHMTSQYFGVRMDLITAESYTKGARVRDVVVVRQAAMKLIKDHTDMHLKAIGKYFAGRDHSTVINASKSIQNLIDTDKNFKKFYNELEREVATMLEGKIYKAKYVWDRELLK